MKIYEIALRNIKNSKSIIIMIALSAMLISTVINLGYSVQQTFTNNILEKTGDEHSYFAGVSKEQVSELQKRTEIERVNLNLTANNKAGLNNSDTNNIDLVYSSALGDVAGYKIIKGHPPKDINEVAIAPHTALILGIEPSVGSHFEMNYINKENTEESTEFIVSAVLQKNEMHEAENTKYVFVSENFIEHLEYSSGVNLKIKEKYNPQTTTFNIASDISIPNENIIINENLLSANLRDPVLIGLIFVIVALLCTVGALVIFNAYNLSNVKKINQFGLLTVIGASKEQIKKCVYYEALYCSIIGIPIGLLFGTLLGYVSIGTLSTLANYNISYEISLYGLILSIVVTLIMVIIGVTSPAKKAAKISPVEAVRFSEQSETTTKREVYNDLSIKTLAKINQKRYKQRTKGTILSLTLAGIFFLAFSTVAFSLLSSTDNMADSSFVGDIQILSKTYGKRNSPSPISSEDFNMINNLNGVNKCYGIVKQSLGGFDSDSGDIIQKGGITGISSDLMLDILDRINKGDTSLKDFDNPQNVICLLPYDKKIMRLERDGVDVNTLLSEYYLGNSLTFDLLDYKGQKTGKSTTLNIVGIIFEDRVPEYSEVDKIYPEFYTLSKIFSEMGWNGEYERIILYIDKSQHTEIFKSIQEIFSQNSEIELKSFALLKDGFNNQISGVITLVMLMMIVIASTCILNLIGTTFIGIEQRKKELGVLMAMGSSKKDIDKLLSFEVLRVSLICSIFATTFGLFLGFLLYQMLHLAGMTFLVFTFPLFPILFLILFYFATPYFVTLVLTKKLSKMTITELIGHTS